jgi:hypothetical protein
MAAFCLIPEAADRFIEALKSGELDPGKLMAMSSAERRAAFATHVGEENAHEVNALFESKLLLADQKRGLVNWARKVGGLTEPARRDIISQINKLDRVLQPADEQSFLEDLAAKKLGTAVTSEEARTIFGLSQAAEKARQAILDAGGGEYRAGWTAEMGTAYGRAQQALVDYVESLKPDGRNWKTVALDVVSLSKPMLTSVLHLSAMGVQGWGMISTRVAWEGFARMFQYFADETHFQDLQGYILGHPDYELAKAAKLGITKLGDQLSAREESIQSTILERMNEWAQERYGVPNLVRASSRAFSGYLNYVRFNRFTDLLNAARLAGEDVSVGSSVVHDLAKVVNDFTGRAELGANDKYASSGPLLNSVFFAPRKVVATMEMFNPWSYVRPNMSPTARIAAARQLTGSLAATGAVLWLAKSMGANVDFDPRSANFGKIQIGETKLDITGGNSGYTRLLARLVTGNTVNAQGKETELGPDYGQRSRADMVVAYLRGKLAPVAGLMADALYGKNPAGTPFSITDELRERLLPITVSSWMNFLQNDPENAPAYLPALTAMFGIGLEPPTHPVTHSGYDVWGQPFNGATWRADPVNQELSRLGYRPDAHYPSHKINGVKLTSEQFEEYARVSGRLAHMQLDALVQSPGWNSLPAGTRLKVMTGAIEDSRRMAQTQIMLQSQGSANDVMALSMAAKAAQAGLTP